jgi:HK97 gp10 family phage protein
MAREAVRIEGLAGVLEQLQALPAEIVSKAGGPVKFALREAANLLRDESKRNVRRIIDTPNQGGDDKSTGLLLLSIVAGRSKPRPGVKGERFAVRIRAKQKYPESRGENLTAAKIGRQLEFGTEKREPMPWLRPAFDSKKNEALQVFSTELRKRTDAAIKRAERLARAKK